MRLRHYLRGLGLGIIVSTLIISAGHRGSAAELTDEEIKTRAKALGMVEEDEMLLSEAKDLAEEAARIDDERQMVLSEDSAGTVSEQNVSGDSALSKNDPGSTGNLKGAGAESALESGVKGDTEAPADEIKPSENVVIKAEKEEKPGIKKETGTEINKEEALSDAGRGSAGRTTSSTSDKKKTSSSDNNQTSSSDKKTTSSSDKKPTSSSDKKTETPPVQEVPEPENTEPAPAPEPAAPSPSGAVTIVKGESSTAVAKKLQQAGFVTDAMQFDQYLCLNGYDRHLVTGTHSIPAGASARDIAEIITSK